MSDHLKTLCPFCGGTSFWTHHFLRGWAWHCPECGKDREDDDVR